MTTPSLILHLCCCTLLLFFLLLAQLALHIHPLHAAPVAPNMSSCHLPNHLPFGESPFDCCAPAASYSARLFRPQPSSFLQVRRPAHAVDAAFADKLSRAYDLMKALPSDDPRSFSQQANIHCAYCNTVYHQTNTSQPFQIHDSWLFFPFHRWYLYFHERILAKLLGDDDLALSFWNYDHPDGASIPWIFSNFSSTLLSPMRDTLHTSPATVAIDFTVDTDTRPREVQLQENDNSMYRSLIRDAAAQHRFFGWPYRQGDGEMTGYGFGTVEEQPHNTVHLWVGKKSAVGWKNMGSLYAGARDPLFYAHHAQLDRLWEIWKTIPNHTEIQDPDYLDSEFAFYNEDAELVRVKVADAINASMLGYVYEDVETPWMNAVPEKRSAGLAELTADDSVCVKGEAISAPCSFIAKRDPEVTRASPWLHDRVVLKVEYDPMKRLHLDIYINLPSADAYTDTGCREYFHSFYSHPSFMSSIMESLNETRRLDMSERLIDLGLQEEENIVVTLVPRFPHNISEGGFMTLVNFFVEYALPTQRWDSTDDTM